MKSLKNPLDRLLRKQRSDNRAPTLGARELEVMKILWAREGLSAQQVLDNISADDISLSTMQSTLERLHRKALLVRTKSGRFYVYHAAISRSTIISQLLGDISEQIGDGDMAPMVSGFLSFIDQQAPGTIAPRALDALHKLPTDNDE